ncbi:calmodulin-binding transcription activator 4-like isoform X1 [Olea europaea subsp. europaea]|uniref:Calmodulin-binding transcription activator 4-like isoform X1 n=1 Tax=Olea europaea subsp. europaea TaxID=158383 RepID=A0A8S0SHP5_OLEEU|nr:calmodulin-binding transcription activator 4-like isoform X1 [Olea europaea subsp. europaea]
MSSTMQSGYDIKYLGRVAQVRWLKPAEVLFILQNHEERQITHKVPHMPASGSLYLFNKRVLKYFRKDGHSWRRRRGQRTTAEAHERLKVGNAEVLNCYYAHGLQNPSFQRRSYWMLDPAYEHIVLVHYRTIEEGMQNARLTSQFSPLSSTRNMSPTSFATQQPESSVVIGESNEPNQSQPSPGSVEISSNEVIEIHGINPSELIEGTEDVNRSPEPDLSEALRRIEQQLSLNDDSEKEFNTISIEDEDSINLENLLFDYDLSAQTSDHSKNLISQSHSGDRMEHLHQLVGPEVNIWGKMLGSSNSLPDVETQAKNEHKLNENGMLLNPSPNEPGREQENYNWQDFDGRGYAPESSMMFTQEDDSIKVSTYSPPMNTYGTDLDCYPTFFDQGQIGIPLEDNLSLTFSQTQKFTIREISPEWCYSSNAAKVVIIGSFLCSSSECAWACMFGDVEVPAQIIQEGVIRCNVPPHLPGKVSLCITSGNRVSCSEVREFEYVAKPSVCAHSNITGTETSKSSEELLLLVRFVHMLLSDPSVQKGDGHESRIDLLSKTKMAENSWSQIIDALLVGTSTSSNVTEWLLQELLKDKLEQWLSSRLRENNQLDSYLSKKELGIIHIVAGLGFEWALQPILSSGVGVNFRDINGWTALHWAAHFGREKMVAALIACGAYAGAVTDPNSQDPTGKTPASIAASGGHRGLAGYLSEMALTGHLSSLTLEESELSKGSAALEAERTVHSISKASSSANDHDSMKYTLAAVWNASQAASRIQSAFRAHSFRKRQQREAAIAIADASRDKYSILSKDVQGLSAASKVTFRNTRDYNKAALSIQKKYRGWKRRKNFLLYRQKAVKIQAHVRGYQTRRYYKVCWAASILEKVVLRWRRRGVGLRGFQLDKFIEESEDEDILKVFRKQIVDVAIEEAVSRVLSMVECPEARQQYRRIFEKYLQAKAELEISES